MFTVQAIRVVGLIKVTWYEIRSPFMRRGGPPSH